MNMPEIDWNNVWESSHEHKLRKTFDSTAFWNKRAPEFTIAVKGSDYIVQFLEIMNPQPDWSVLDVGSAAGTLAVPLAKIVRQVTAFDPSSRMRELLHERCEKEGITNIRILDCSWEQDWETAGIEQHDVVMASRSLIVSDLRAALLKAHRFARKKVYLSTLVGEGPHDSRILNAVGREHIPGVDYIIVLNLLRQMGIYANVTFTYTNDREIYIDLDAAVEGMRWMVHDMTPEEEKKLRYYLQQILVPFEDGFSMPYEHPVRWAALYWDKTTGCDADPGEK